MKFFSRGIFISLLLSLLLTGNPAPCAEVESPPPQTTSPGAAEVIPRLAELKKQSGDLLARLELLQKTSAFAEPLQIARDRAEALIPEFSEPTISGTLNTDRLLETRGQLVDQQKSLTHLLAGISLRLGEIDSLSQNWQDKQIFWRKWRADLPKDLLQTQREAFREATGEIDKALQQIVAASNPLVALQNEVVQLQEQNQGMVARVDEMLQTLSGKTFQKTARSFTSPEFYRQFDHSLLESVKAGIAGVSGIDRNFFRQQGWLVGLQLLVVAFLAGFLLHRRRKGAVTEEWRFIILHPLATALFVSIAVCGPLYSAPPALLRWLLSFLAAFSAATLVSGLLDDPYKRLMIYVLAGVFALTLGLQIIGLPLPLYRLYLTLLSLLGIPFLLVLIARQRQAPGRRGGYFILVLRLGVVVLFCSFVAQWGGFSTLSSRLVESSSKTVFLSLFAWMTLHLGRGGCEYLLNLSILRRTRFVTRFGAELELRMKRVLLVIILVYVVFYLLGIWGIFPSARQAWQAFLQLEYSLGEKNISIHLVLLAVLTLYVSIQCSWIMRALLDAEFFPLRVVDRGVHDSIMKLLHYGVIIFGFLLAMSMLGFELKNLVVLAGALGIGIGFGLQNIVNNFVSGLILLFERPVKVGDMIMIESDWCTVRKIGMRATTVETFDQSEIIVPNADLISQKVTNWTLSSEQSRVVVKVGVAYGSEVEKIMKILVECATQHPKVLREPPPSPLFAEFGDSSLDFLLRVWVAKASDRLMTKSELLMAIEGKFRQEGVEIPFPQRDLHLRSVDGKVLEKLSTDPPDKDEPD